LRKDIIKNDICIAKYEKIFWIILYIIINFNIEI
jgi:hypothetical protein